jgi:hypothetical protein
MSEAGISAFGKRSEIKAWNNGRSSFKNFGILDSLMALIRTISSPRSCYDLLSDPAITSTDFTALIPKS